MGRKPKPYDLKEAEGFRGHRPHSQGVDVPQGDFLSPVTLGLAAKKEWNRIIEVAFWLRSSDAAALADRCVCWQRLQEAESAIKKRGMLIETDRGLRQNPAISVAKTYRVALQRYDAELGLTASSRTKVGGGASTEKPASGPGKGPMDAIERALCGQLPN